MNKEIIALLTEDGILHERIADLEAERDTYRFWFQQTLHALHEAVAREAKRREQEQRILDDLRALRAIVVAESYEDAPAVMQTFDHILARDHQAAILNETVQ